MTVRFAAGDRVVVRTNDDRGTVETVLDFWGDGRSNVLLLVRLDDHPEKVKAFRPRALELERQGAAR